MNDLTHYTILPSRRRWREAFDLIVGLPLLVAMAGLGLCLIYGELYVIVAFVRWVLVLDVIGLETLAAISLSVFTLFVMWIRGTI
jgi:hypothetical protein